VTTDVELAERQVLTEDDFRDLYPRLRRFAAVVGSSATEPDDLVQEALARLMRRGDPPDDPERFLRSVIVNLTIDLGRRSTRWDARAPRLVGPSDHRDQYPSDVDVLETLSPIRRAVLWLADVEHWTFDEIGELLDIRPTTARKHASRARAELRVRLNEPGQANQQGAFDE
jgi:RNA polymerase sigma factor (sigma-70 family)